MTNLLYFLLILAVVSTNACRSSHKEIEIMRIATYHNPSLCTTYCYSNCVVAAQQHELHIESYTCEKPDPYGRDTRCECTLFRCHDI
ncbi:hypothetical protein IIV22A_077R [Invertebrate iridescent virus 22]|uniref:Uncharacterized protein n=1 Tax=Invertebrate iridescent virus 22 TaxID=345198 RepID=W8W1Z1_9VIRU|nr:hypothetical protein IIV22A_077R [Invertebrate iridescent virus 22]CCV01921.1 hypothetical protein IIV22A_077R [Invertebrate iridescent virus 22]